MKKTIFVYLLLAALFFCLPALAENTYLDLGEEAVSDWDAFYARLDSQPELTKVDMFATVVGSEEIDALVERYPDIEFGWTINFENHTVRTDATAFSTLHYSADPGHRNNEIEFLRYCKELRMLDIGHNKVDDLSFLYDLPELRILIIACNNVEDITPIGSLKHLEYLEMFSNWVKDISVLKELPHLSHLNIAYNSIGDLSPLFEMPQLKRLWMNMAHSRQKSPPVDAKTMQRLQESLPICEINTKSSPTGGSWRETVYYEVLDQIYSTGTYMPFPDSPVENQ